MITTVGTELEAEKKQWVTEWVAIEELQIDPAYQREPNPARVKKIAENFDRALAGVLLVNKRTNGSLFVMDGQHRLEAMKLRKYDMALCNVYQGLTQAQEASIYHTADTQTSKLTALDAFRAKLIAQDAEALDIRRIVEKNGLRIYIQREGTHPGKKRPSTTIWAIATLQDIYQKDKGKLLDATLELARLSWPGEGEVFKDKFLLGLAHFHQKYQGEYRQQDFIEKMHTISLAAVHQKAHALATEGGGAMVVSYSKAFWSLYNRGRRTRILPYKYV